MSAERKHVLELLAQGKINAEDAERLLDKLAASAPPDQAPRPGVAAPAPKFLCVKVDSKDGDQVDIRLPLALVRAGIKFSAMMPKDAVDAMSRNGVDLSHLSALSGDELVEALRNITIDVASREGDQVKVFCQ